MSRKSLVKMIKQSQKPFDFADSFLTDLQYTIVKLDKLDTKPPSNSVSPSQMKCIRQMAYKLLGVPLNEEKDKSPNFVDICNVGRMRHEALQNTIYHMKDFGLNCEYVDVANYVKEHNIDVRIGTVSDFENGIYETHLYSDKYHASFLCDGIIKYKNKYFILEIKTESGFKYLKQKGIQEEHKNQAIAYSLLLGIPDVMFLYEDRDLLNKKAYIYTPTYEEKEMLAGNIFYAIDKVKLNKVPALTWSKSEKICGYCSYCRQCRLDGKEECDYTPKQGSEPQI